MKNGILLSRVRVEEKWLLEALEKRAVEFERIDDRAAHFDINEPGLWTSYSVVLERSLSPVHANGSISAKHKSRNHKNHR